MITNRYTYHANLDNSISAGLEPFTELVRLEMNTYAGVLSFNVRPDDLEGIIDVLLEAQSDLVDELHREYGEGDAVS